MAKIKVMSIDKILTESNYENDELRKAQIHKESWKKCYAIFEMGYFAFAYTKLLSFKPFCILVVFLSLQH